MISVRIGLRSASVQLVFPLSCAGLFPMILLLLAETAGFAEAVVEVAEAVVVVP